MTRLGVAVTLVFTTMALGQPTEPKVAFTIHVGDLQLADKLLQPSRKTPKRPVDKQARALQELKLKKDLMNEFFNGRGTGYILVTPEEVMAAEDRIKRDDYAESDAPLTVLASLTDTQFGLSLAIHVGILKTQPKAPIGVTLTTRVVSRDGKRFREPTVFEWLPPSGKYSSADAMVRAAFPSLASQARIGLKLETLPAVEEVRTPSPSPTAAPTGERPGEGLSVSRPLPSPPPLPPAEDRSTQRLVGRIGVGAGVGVAVAGAVLLGLASADNSRLTPNAAHNLPADQQDTVRAAQAKQGVGIGLVAVGGVVAAVGAGLWLLAPPAPVVVTPGPIGSGAGVFVGGSLP